MTYAVDGVQYVAVQVGYGGHPDYRGSHPPEQCSSQVFKTPTVLSPSSWGGGTGADPGRFESSLLFPKPPEQKATQAQIDAGEVTFIEQCTRCHQLGPSSTPDLRKLNDGLHATFKDIFAGEARWHRPGMERFSDILSDKDAGKTSHAYLIEQSWIAYRAQESAAAATNRGLVRKGTKRMLQPGTDNGPAAADFRNHRGTRRHRMARRKIVAREDAWPGVSLTPMRTAPHEPGSLPMHSPTLAYPPVPWREPSLGTTIATSKFIMRCPASGLIVHTCNPPPASRAADLYRESRRRRSVVLRHELCSLDPEHRQPFAPMSGRGYAWPMRRICPQLEGVANVFCYETLIESQSDDFLWPEF